MKVAVVTPPDGARACRCPAMVLPSLKVTVPVGVPAPGLVGGDRGGEGHRWPKTDGIRRGRPGRVRGRPCSTTGSASRRGAGEEVGVAAVDGGDRVAADRRGGAVLKVAVVTPPAVLSVPVPRIVPPSMKVTVPVGVPAPGPPAATVAVKVTAWPKGDGFAEDRHVVVVAAWFTTGLRALEVLVESLGRRRRPP